MFSTEEASWAIKECLSLNNNCEAAEVSPSPAEALGLPPLYHPEAAPPLTQAQTLGRFLSFRIIYPSYIFRAKDSGAF